MWTYRQSTGELSSNGELLESLTADAGVGLNNPALQDVANVGPLPQGSYRIGAPYTDPTRGPLVMHLVPAAANLMFGRAGFLIHGDNAQLNHTASEGCIVLARTFREVIALSADRQLTVIS